MSLGVNTLVKMTDVQRFVAHVKPHRDHPRYFEWQTAVACIFIGETDRELAQKRADEEIRAHGWQRIEFIDRATLIEERVRAEGGAVLDAFLSARQGTPFYFEQLDEIPFATKESRLPLLAPRVTEAFVDRVILTAGGERLDAGHSRPDNPKTADYRVGRYILELKDLQTESLDFTTRQEKLARLFASKLRPDRSAIIDAEDLTVQERRQYLEIVGEPIRKRLREAGKQVRATLDRITDKRMRGGAILINSGYGSVSPEILWEVAQDYASKSSTVQTVLCISVWTLTNGSDTVVNFTFDPRSRGAAEIRRLREAFWREVNIFMTDWARSGFVPPTNAAEPRRPIVFETAEGLFALPAPKPPNSIGWPSE
jgi:hypothetical protein